MPDTVFLPDRIEVTRPIAASPTTIFDIVRSPAGHVAIDASGMLQDYTGEPAEKVGDTFVIHMDRESLNDFPMGKYDVTVHIIKFERDREIAWNLGPDIPFPHFYGYRIEPGEDGVTNVTSYYDWSLIGRRHQRPLPDRARVGVARHARDFGADCPTGSLKTSSRPRRLASGGGGSRTGTSRFYVLPCQSRRPRSDTVTRAPRLSSPYLR